jgi:inositol phosphorylceramide mannosyltransferase catalytic subunit
MWIGGPVPAHILDWMSSWRDHHPRWDYMLWTDAEMSDFGLRNQGLWDRAERITPEAPHQFRSDVARYEILQRYGGVWVDADFECHAPIDDLLDSSGFLVWEVAGQWLANGLFGAVRDLPLCDVLVNDLPGNVRRHGPTVSNTRKSGPQYVTPRALRHTGSIDFLPTDWFLPYSYRELDRMGTVQGKYATHHWNHRRARLEGRH